MTPSGSPAACTPSSTLAVASVQLCRTELALLERLAYSRDELREHLPALAASADAAAAVVVSTCNRTELYAELPSGTDPRRLADALAADRGVPAAVVRSAARVLTGAAAVRHLLRVVAGLDSLVIGEAQVAGQVRAAAIAARNAGVLSGQLDALFRAAARTARVVRSESALGRTERSLGAAAIDHAAALLGGAPGPALRPLGGRVVLIVGAGQLAGAVARRARAYGAAVLVCNRTRSRALGLVADPADALGLDRLDRALTAADVAVICTSSPHPLIRPALLRGRADGARPRLLIDLGLPRNVDPAVRAVPGVMLRDLDDLREIGLPEAARHRAAVAEAEAIVEAEAERFADWLRVRRAAALIRDLHGAADGVVRTELARFAAAHSGAEAEVTELVVRRVVAKLLHAPTTALRQAAAAGDDALLERARQLLGSAGPASASEVSAPLALLGHVAQRDRHTAGLAPVAQGDRIARLGGIAG